MKNTEHTNSDILYALTGNIEGVISDLKLKAGAIECLKAKLANAYIDEITIDCINNTINGLNVVIDDISDNCVKLDDLRIQMMDVK